MRLLTAFSQRWRLAETIPPEHAARERRSSLVASDVAASLESAEISGHGSVERHQQCWQKDSMKVLGLTVRMQLDGPLDLPSSCPCDRSYLMRSKRASTLVHAGADGWHQRPTGNKCAEQKEPPSSDEAKKEESTGKAGRFLPGSLFSFEARALDSVQECGRPVKLALPFVACWARPQEFRP